MFRPAMTLPSDRFLQCALDVGTEDVNRLRPDKNTAVDEESGCTPHAVAPAVLQVLCDDMRLPTRVEALIEAPGIEADFRRIPLQTADTERGAVREESVVILPELPLVEGAFGSLRGLGRISVGLDDGEIPHDVLDPIPVLFNDQGIGSPEVARAERALIVCELHYGHCRIRRATVGPLMADEIGRRSPVATSSAHRRRAVALRAGLALRSRQADPQPQAESKGGDQRRPY